MMTLKELFAEHPQIIINSDLDGIASGLLLKQYYDVDIVGFSNSRDKIWVTPDVRDFTRPVYIDIFVANKQLVCIDQHIIAADAEHLEALRQNPNKINPNFTLGRTFLDSYCSKYPFGTLHYLIARMLGEGVDVRLPVLTCRFSKFPQVQFGHMLLRADDALFSTLGPYSDNARQWWTELLTLSGAAPEFQRLVDYIYTIDAADNYAIKTATNEFFLHTLGCDGEDGAFYDVTDADGRLLQRINTFVNTLEHVTGWCCGYVLPQAYVVKTGTYRKYAATRTNLLELKRILTSDEMYSYSFIFGPNSASNPHRKNLSFTTNLQ